jgi:endonuclease YncB( thermonuclease family)
MGALRVRRVHSACPYQGTAGKLAPMKSRDAKAALLLLAGGLLLAPAGAADLDRTYVALDGDTLLNQQTGDRVDLWGVRAPALDAWPFGNRARAHLDSVLADTGRLSCRTVRAAGDDRPAQAVCDGSGLDDVGEAQIRAGWAVENRAQTRAADARALLRLAEDYAEAEARARGANAGIWNDQAF